MVEKKESNTVREAVIFFGALFLALPLLFAMVFLFVSYAEGLDSSKKNQRRQDVCAALRDVSLAAKASDAYEWRGGTCIHTYSDRYSDTHVKEEF